TRYRPRFKLPYALVTNLLELAPGADMLTDVRAGQLSPVEFKTRYESRLDELDVHRLLRQLGCLQADHRADGVVLLCYEDLSTGASCHRRMLAEWMQRRIGIVVPELSEPAAQQPDRSTELKRPKFLQPGATR